MVRTAVKRRKAPVSVSRHSITKALANTTSRAQSTTQPRRFATLVDLKTRKVHEKVNANTTLKAADRVLNKTNVVATLPGGITAIVKVIGLGGE